MLRLLSERAREVKTAYFFPLHKQSTMIHLNIFGLRILVLANLLGLRIASQTVSLEVDELEESKPFTTKRSLPNRCLLKTETGPCKHFIHKWTYNLTEGKCRTFLYGGCLGNENRFHSETECLHHCVGGVDNTLPSYMVTKGSVFVASSTSTTSSPSTTTTSRSVPTFTPLKPRKPPVPKHKREKELTFMESGYEKTFMFAQSNTFIQLDGSGIKTFQLRGQGGPRGR